MEVYYNEKCKPVYGILLSLCKVGTEKLERKDDYRVGHSIFFMVVRMNASSIRPRPETGI